ncbi:methyltransferase [Sphingomonas sp. KRR8]|uniref:methyltransferase n=1 Tax=Sphingomonas sp. KRR8 TaxID=2942996 RepID=UPI0020214356|nr:methyltransferase [Sphingomonas sp. KRR8]URD60959.1 methyltransferase [Sphingomonas sp. KRR8]
MHDSLIALLRELDADGYQFTCVTPRTHQRILTHRGRDARAADLRDIFGWNLPFARDLLQGPVLDALKDAGGMAQDGDLFRSRYRVAELDGRLFLHSSFPTTQEDSVFFGPDTHRFARFLAAELADLPDVAHVVDLGAGGGAGGILVAGLAEPARVTLTDINPKALELAAANAAAAGVEVELTRGDLAAVDGTPDLIVANPPFMADAGSRTYRDGGGDLGTGLSVEWAKAAMARLADGGAMLLYTGSPIVAGEDRLLTALSDAVDEAGCTLRYDELDPDIFGEELDQPAYVDAQVERIAAVGAVLRKE